MLFQETQECQGMVKHRKIKQNQEKQHKTTEVITSKKLQGGLKALKNATQTPQLM